MSIYLPRNFNPLPTDLIGLVCEYGTPSHLSQGKSNDRLILIINNVMQRLWKEAFPESATQVNRQSYPLIQAWIDSNGYPTTKNVRELFCHFACLFLNPTPYRGPTLIEWLTCSNDPYLDKSHASSIIGIHPDFYQHLERMRQSHVIMGISNHMLLMPRFTQLEELQKWCNDNQYTCLLSSVTDAHSKEIKVRLLLTETISGFKFGCNYFGPLKIRQLPL